MQGATGPTGLQGATGPTGPTGYTITFVELTADLAARPGTTLFNTTGLLFTAATGSAYEFEFGVVFTVGTAASAGLKLGMTFPAATIFAATVQIPLTTAAAAGMWNGWITASGGSVVATTAPTSATQYLAVITGNIIASTGGVVQVQHASGATGFNITVKQGSWGIINTLAAVG